jgi:ABC-type Zn uptake system ZnuABC Zn-binding protein ZnuA
LDYGLIQVPIAGLSPEEEPSSGQFAELKEYAEKIISIIFVLKRMLMIQKLWPTKLG